jgi:hypothetical protein
MMILMAAIPRQGMRDETTGHTRVNTYGCNPTVIDGGVESLVVDYAGRKRSLQLGAPAFPPSKRPFYGCDPRLPEKGDVSILYWLHSV